MQLIAKIFRSISGRSSLRGKYFSKPHIEDTIQRLSAKYTEKNKLFQRDKTGNTLAIISNSSRKFSKLLAGQFENGSINASPASVRKISLGNKSRMFYKFNVKDKLVHSILADILAEKQEDYISERLFSFRKSKSWWSAVASFTQFIREYLHQVQDKQSQGLYVLRTDIKNYSDSIPVHNQSSLWPLLKKMFSENDDNEIKVFQLLKKFLRPAVYSKNQYLHSPLYGISFGTPLCVLIDNLYIKDLDFLLENTDKNAFYARYGDDILFAHKNYEVVKIAEELIHNFLKLKELEVGVKKHKIFYFNGCGKSPNDNPAVSGTSKINFLGVSVAFDATVSLRSAEIRNIKHEISQRLRNYHRCLIEPDAELRIRKLCSFIPEMFDPQNHYSIASANMLRKCITSRLQLKSIDLFIAQTIAEIITSSKGPKAFKKLPYNILRREYGLQSLCMNRNFRPAN